MIILVCSSGKKCDQCQYGFYEMSASNTLGCRPCNCNPFGSTNQFCDPLTGQCQCKDQAKSRQCNECKDGYWGFEEGCLTCDCNPIGTQPSGVCDKQTGQCPCKAHVEGLKCANCTDETYGFGSSADFGCVACTCNPAGTVNGSMLCDKVSTCRLVVLFGINSYHLYSSWIHLRQRRMLERIFFFKYSLYNRLPIHRTPFIPNSLYTRVALNLTP